MSIVVVGSFVHAQCWQVARLPAPGDSLAASSWFSEFGGKGLNVAVGARRLGARVELLMGVGDDAAGEAVRRRLSTEGVGVRHVHVLPGPSGQGGGFIAAGGGNMVVVAPGANALLSASHAAAAQHTIASARVVYGQFEAALPAVEKAFALARAAGATTVLNPSPWQPVPEPLLADVDWLLLNAQEAAALLAPGVALEALAWPELLALLADARAARCWPGLVLTLGARGCVALRAGAAPLVVPAPVVTAVDATGAGDAFAAGFCATLDQGLPLAAALRLGNACGARVASRPGVLAALPTRAELDI